MMAEPKQPFTAHSFSESSSYSPDITEVLLKRVLNRHFTHRHPVILIFPLKHTLWPHKQAAPMNVFK